MIHSVGRGRGKNGALILNYLSSPCEGLLRKCWKNWVPGLALHKLQCEHRTHYPVSLLLPEKERFIMSYSLKQAHASAEACE